MGISNICKKMKNEKRVILTTTYTGFNYGTSLQALAGKYIVSKLGYKCDFVRPKSLIKGRDIRFGKLLKILWRVICLRDVKKISPFISSYKKRLVEGTETKFFRFNDKYIQPQEFSWIGLKRIAKKSVACLAGSDQIWVSDALYVDPIYYLRFVPEKKRIAFAPSFGRDYIAEYNVKKISKWISEIPYLSVREDSGVKLIKELTGRDSVRLFDPTLGVSREEWMSLLNVTEKKENYILAYFLDKPSVFAVEKIKDLKLALGCKVVGIPYLFDNMGFCDEKVSAGPKEFVGLILNARLVCTDSFHGTAFSINFHTPFYTYERMYGTATKQSVRIISLLNQLELMSRYQQDNPVSYIDRIEFERVDGILAKERLKIYSYLKDSILAINNYER